MGQHKKKTFIKKVIFYIALGVVCLALLGGIIAAFSINSYNPNTYNATTLSTGGGKGTENVNISTIGITSASEGEKQVVSVTLKFVNGGVLSESTPLEAAPKYKVSFLQNPLRLAVEIEGVEYWDYVVSGVPTDNTGLINGMFQSTLSGEAKKTVLYFNLSRNVKFKVAEGEGGSLTVALIPDGDFSSEESYYLLCDGFYEYQQGTLPSVDFTPALCDDYISVIMISKPYGNLSDAEKARDGLLTGSLEGHQVRIAHLKQGQMPQYSENTNMAGLLSESVLSIDGAKTSLPLFFADARFLCWLPDDSGALFAKTEEGVEKLYTADKVGTKHLLTPQSFSTIGKATFSKDGKTLAFVEYTEDTELVTIINVETGAIRVLGSGETNPLGKVVLDIALNDDGTKLFCLSGDQMYSLQEFDLATNESKMLVLEAIVETELIYNNGYLYYCDVVDEWEVIVRRNVETNEQQVLHKGSQFSLSKDGKTLAVITENYTTAVRDLKVVDIETGAWETVLADIVTSEFFIAPGNNSVFFVIETGDEEFYYQIMKYDIALRETSVMAQCINGVFFPSNKDNEVIISVIYSTEEGAQPVTYIADFDKMTVSGEE